MLRRLSFFFVAFTFSAVALEALDLGISPHILSKWGELDESLHFRAHDVTLAAGPEGAPPSLVLGDRKLVLTDSRSPGCAPDEADECALGRAWWRLQSGTPGKHGSAGMAVKSLFIMRDADMCPYFCFFGKKPWTKSDGLYVFTGEGHSAGGEYLKKQITDGKPMSLCYSRAGAEGLEAFLDTCCSKYLREQVRRDGGK